MSGGASPGQGKSHADGGCWAKVAISAKGVHGRTNIGFALIWFVSSVQTNHIQPPVPEQGLQNPWMTFLICVFLTLTLDDFLKP